jgi:hypothetical protein
MVPLVLAVDLCQNPRELRVPLTRHRSPRLLDIRLFTHPLAGCLGFFDGKQPQNTCQIKKLRAKSRKPPNLRILDPFLTTPKKTYFSVIALINMAHFTHFFFF